MSLEYDTFTCPDASTKIRRYVALLSPVQPEAIPVAGARAFPAAAATSATVSRSRVAKLSVLLALDPERALCASSSATGAGTDRLDGGLQRCRNASCLDTALLAAFHRRHLDTNGGVMTSRPITTNGGATKSEASPTGAINAPEIDAVLRVLNRQYVPPETNASASEAECINGDSVLNEIDDITGQEADAQLSAISTSLLRHLLKGDCLALPPEEAANVNQLFAQFGTDSEATEDQRMNKTGFSFLIGRLNDMSNECVIVPSGKQASRASGFDTKLIADGELQHDSHGNQSHKRRRSLDDGNQEHLPACLDWQKLFGRFDADHSNDLDGTEFATLCPMIISEWAVVNPLHDHDVHRAPVPRPERPASSQAYVYGTLSITAISLCSLLGVVVIPCIKSVVYSYIMVGLVAMGFGILTGDAILHLMPQALGLHATNHEESSGGHSHDGGVEGPEFPPYLDKCVAILGAIYALFLFEGISRVVMPSHSHSHSHQNGNADSLSSNEKQKEKQEKSPTVAINLKSISQQTLTNHSETVEGTDDDQPDGLETIHNFAEKSPVLFCGMKNLAVVVIMGDTIHNFADGLVVGAAFAGGLQGGLSTSLAVLCHELPHELGDFALLLSTGLSKRRVILLNVASSLSAFVGLYIGVALGSNESLVQWTMAVTAGMFLFIGLGSMMPELKTLATDRPLASALVQNIAVLSGMAFTYLMAIFEKSIHL